MFLNKSITAYLLLLLLFSTQSSLVISRICIHVHKVIEKRAKRKNITLVFTEAEWSQIEKNDCDEVILQGKFFDIKKIKKESYKVIVTGHYDSEEDELSSAEKERQTHKSKFKKNSFQDLYTFLEKAQNHNLNIFFFDKLKFIFDNNYTFHFRKTDIPPPKRWS